MPGTVTADGETTTTLTVTAKDAEGNVIPDATVTLTASGTGNTFTTPITGTTNAEGVFTTTLSSTVAQDDTFTALINGTASETASVDFTAGGVSQATSSLTAVARDGDGGRRDHDDADGDGEGCRGQPISGRR